MPPTTPTDAYRERADDSKKEAESMRNEDLAFWERVKASKYAFSLDGKKDPVAGRWQSLGRKTALIQSLANKASDAEPPEASGSRSLGDLGSNTQRSRDSGMHGYFKYVLGFTECFC